MGRPLPTGTVTFLMTDIEASTRLWSRHPERMATALDRHDAIITGAIERHGGFVVTARGGGDSFFGVFESARAAVDAVVELQCALHEEQWPEGIELRVRAALHTGEAERMQGGNYYGEAVIRCARLRDIGHGGQVLLTEATQRQLVNRSQASRTLKPMGRHRLKDLPHTEVVFQLLHPTLPGQFPELRSLDAHTNNLPRRLSSFVGRRHETATVRQLIETHRLVTLTGPGGSGKTRLALHVAGRMVDDFEDGTWFVPLDSIEVGELVARRVADTLNVREPPGEVLLDSIAEWLGSKHVLLVVDNCEHVITEAASIIETLLERCPSVHLLATSRELLRVPGEISWSIPPMRVPDGTADIHTDSLSEYDALTLFVERASQRNSDFHLTPDRVAKIGQLCRQLDGNPLAVELAAARTRMLSLDTIIERTQRSLRILSGGPRSAPPRQRSVELSIADSFDLLSRRERLAFVRLSVFMGGCTLDAAEEVIGFGDLAAEDVLDTLSGLEQKSVLSVDESATEPPVLRYKLNYILRSYARSRLDEGDEGDVVLRRHADWCVALAEQAETRLQGIEEQRWLAQLLTEQDNLQAALVWCENTNNISRGLRLASALWRFWYMRGQLDVGQAHVDTLLERSDHNIDRTLLAKAHHAAGTLAMLRADPAAAKRHLETALTLRRDLDAPLATAETLNNLAGLAYNEGQLHESRQLYREALDLKQQLGSATNIQSTMINLAQVALALGDNERAAEIAEQQLAHSTRANRPEMSGRARYMLAVVAQRRGDYEVAERQFKECEKDYREQGNLYLVAELLLTRGMVAREQGEAEPALSLLRRGEKYAAAVGSDFLDGLLNRYRGEAWLDLREPTRAKAAFERALQASSRETRIYALLGLARVHLEYEDHAQCLSRIRMAAELALQDARSLLLIVCVECYLLYAASLGHPTAVLECAAVARLARDTLHLRAPACDAKRIDAAVAEARRSVGRDSAGGGHGQAEIKTPEEYCSVILSDRASLHVQPAC